MGQEEVACHRHQSSSSLIAAETSYCHEQRLYHAEDRDLKLQFLRSRVVDLDPLSLCPCSDSETDALAQIGLLLQVGQCCICIIDIY